MKPNECKRKYTVIHTVDLHMKCNAWNNFIAQIDINIHQQIHLNVMKIEMANRIKLELLHDFFLLCFYKFGFFYIVRNDQSHL